MDLTTIRARQDAINKRDALLARLGEVQTGLLRLGTAPADEVSLATLDALHEDAHRLMPELDAQNKLVDQLTAQMR